MGKQFKNLMKEKIQKVEKNPTKSLLMIKEINIKGSTPANIPAKLFF